MEYIFCKSSAVSTYKIISQLVFFSFVLYVPTSLYFLCRFMLEKPGLLRSILL